MKAKSQILQKRRIRIKKRIRKKLTGTAEKPRVVVYRGLKNIIAQLNDDTSSTTILSVDSRMVAKDIKGHKNKTEISREVGKLLAEKSLEKNIKQVVFDRSGYRYKGRVKALADGAREAGLEF